VLQLNTGSDGAVLTSYPVISIHHVTWLDGLMATMAGLIRDVSAVTWPRTWSVMLCYFGLSRILAAASKRRGGWRILRHRKCRGRKTTWESILLLQQIL